MSIIHSQLRDRTRLRVWFGRHFGRLGIKFSLLSMVLIAVLTIGTAVIVIEIMDGFLFRELVKRGTALAVSTTTPAGYSILVDDRLGLDHLVDKIEKSQSDLLYIAIADGQGKLLAHSQLDARGGVLSPPSGELLLQQDEISVHRTAGEGHEVYAFTAPIVFHDARLGTLQLGIATAALEQSKSQARRQILLVAVCALLIGSVTTFFLTRIVTRPVARLSRGVARLRSGEHDAPIPAYTQDELGDLTRSFNAMSAELLEQKERLADYAENLEAAYLDTVKILAAAIEARDPYTLGHSQRVAGLSLMLGRQIGLDTEALRELEVACFLHDVGKIRVPDRVLAKNGPLSSDERTLMTQHVQHGAEILSLASSLQRFVPVALSHHEHYDGCGYPSGIQGEDIPLFAAIVSIADAYDAMTSSRPYRAGRSSADALAELQRCRGTQFTPHLVDHFMTALAENPEIETFIIEGAA